jgi:hypothetical protein
MIEVWKQVPFTAPEGFEAIDVIRPGMNYLDDRTITVHVQRQRDGKHKISYRNVSDDTVVKGTVIELLEAQEAHLRDGFIDLWWGDIAKYFYARAMNWMLEDKFARVLKGEE